MNISSKACKKKERKRKKKAWLNLIQERAGELASPELVYPLRKAFPTVRGLSLTDIYPPAYKWFYMCCSFARLITVWSGGGAKTGQ